jgi:hypothetical protein
MRVRGFSGRSSRKRRKNFNCIFCQGILPIDAFAVAREPLNREREEVIMMAAKKGCGCGCMGKQNRKARASAAAQKKVRKK